MGNFFSLDSKFSTFMSRITDLMLLNILYLITCIPIFTIGAATTALYTICFRMGTDRETGIVKPFFRAFRDNFSQSTVLWLILLVIGGIIAVDLFVCYHAEGFLHVLFYVFMLMALLLIFLCSYTFPLVSQFYNSNKGTLRNALFFSICYLPKTVVIAILNVFPLILPLFNLPLFFQLGMVWILFYNAVVAYGNSHLLRKVFTPYYKQAAEQQQAEETEPQEQ